MSISRELLSRLELQTFQPIALPIQQYTSMQFQMDIRYLMVILKQSAIRILQYTSKPLAVLRESQG